MLKDQEFNQAYDKAYGKTPQQALIDIFDGFTPQELNDRNVGRGYALFVLTEWQGCGRHDELSEGIREDIQALIQHPPDKLRDVVIVVRQICDRLDDLCEGDGHGEGRIIKRFYKLQERLRGRKFEAPEPYFES